MAEDKLKALRKQIDEIDGKLVPLFCKRMDTAPVSYTHLDVYKRQSVDKSVGV